MAKQDKDIAEESNRVFDIPELLEEILLNIPIKDILINAQRVSRVWKRTADYSPKLQQALFYEATPSNEIAVSLQTEGANFSRKWTLTSTAKRDLSVMRSRFKKLMLVKNPLCRRLLHRQIQLQCPRWVKAVARPDASWRRMLLSQPPIEFTMGKAVKTKAGTLGEVAGEPDHFGKDLFTAQTMLRWIEPATASSRKVNLAKDVRRKLR